MLINPKYNLQYIELFSRYCLHSTVKRFELYAIILIPAYNKMARMFRNTIIPLASRLLRIGNQIHSNIVLRKAHEKINLEAQVKQQAFLAKQRRHKSEKLLQRLQTLRLLFSGTTFVILFSGFAAWYYPEHRFHASKNNPYWGRILDQVLGPMEDEEKEKYASKNESYLGRRILDQALGPIEEKEKEQYNTDKQSKDQD